MTQFTRLNGLFRERETRIRLRETMFREKGVDVEAEVERCVSKSLINDTRGENDDTSDAVNSLFMLSHAGDRATSPNGSSRTQATTPTSEARESPGYPVDSHEVDDEISRRSASSLSSNAFNDDPTVTRDQISQPPSV